MDIGGAWLIILGWPLEFLNFQKYFKNFKNNEKIFKTNIEKFEIFLWILSAILKFLKQYMYTEF